MLPAIFSNLAVGVAIVRTTLKASHATLCRGCHRDPLNMVVLADSLVSVDKLHNTGRSIGLPPTAAKAEKVRFN